MRTASSVSRSRPEAGNRNHRRGARTLLQHLRSHGLAIINGLFRESSPFEPFFKWARLNFLNMQVLEPITIADARAFLSLNLHDTEEDALLEMLISGARAQAETYLRRHIAQQEVKILLSSRVEVEVPDRILFLNEVTAKYADGDYDLLPETVIVGDNTLEIPCDRGGQLRISYMCDEFCPPEVKSALLMMVRNSYTDRSANPLTEDIKGMLAPHRVMRI